MTPEDMSALKREGRRIEWGALALGLTILVQTAGIVWWGAKLDQRVSSVEARMVSNASAGETIARLDERTAAMQTSIDRIYTQLEADQSRDRK